jgi:hypothetical protein
MNRQTRLLLLALALPILVMGQERWRYSYGMAGTEDAGGISCGLGGNIYVAGKCMNETSTWDFTVISLDADGNERWVYRYDGPMGRWDEATCITCSPDGYIYAAGYSEDTVNIYDITVVCLDTSGTEQWVYRRDWKNDYDRAVDIIRGSDGNLYVTGSVQDRTTTGIDLPVISLDPDGHERWMYVYSETGNGPEYAEEIHQGPDGNIYVAGTTEPNSWDFTVISLTPDSGRQRWIYQYDGPANYHDRAKTLTSDSAGNIYVAGESWVGEDRYDILIVSLTDQGLERWGYTQSGPKDDAITDILLGPDNNVYAAGYLTDYTLDRTFEVVCLDTSGHQYWEYNDFYGGVYDLAYGRDNNLYAAGYTTYPTFTKYTVLSLDPAGNGRWVYRYQGQGGVNSAHEIVCPLDGNVYSAGYENGLLTGMDVAVISLATTVGIEDGKEALGAESVRAPTFFRDKIVLNLGAKSSGPVSFALYALDGSMVSSRKFDRAGTELVVVDPGLARLPAGVYFASVSVPGRPVSSLKLVRR